MEPWQRTHTLIQRRRRRKERSSRRAAGGKSGKARNGVAREMSSPKERRGKEPRRRITGSASENGQERERKSENGKMDAGVRAAVPPTRAEAEPEAEPRPDHAPGENPRNVPRATGWT